MAAGLCEALTKVIDLFGACCDWRKAGGQLSPPSEDATSRRTAVASSRSMAASAREAQRAISSARTHALTEGTDLGDTLSSRTPSPSRTGIAVWSAAASPQTVTGILPAVVWQMCRMSLSTPGSKGSERAATAAFPRSAASVYWVRSFVPMLTKSRWGGTSRSSARRRHFDHHADA